MEHASLSPRNRVLFGLDGVLTVILVSLLLCISQVAYGPTAFGQEGESASGQTDYGQASDGQASSDLGSGGQDSFAGGMIGGGQATDGQADGQAADGQSAIGEPAIGEPTLGQPAIGEPTIGEPALGEPTLGQPAIGEPTLGQPAIGEPALGEPTLGQPALGQPASRLPRGGIKWEGPPILPARPGSVAGGNPIEGLGRPDDPNPTRMKRSNADSSDSGGTQPEGRKQTDSSRRAANQPVGVTRTLAPLHSSPQPGETHHRGGFTDFSEQQKATQRLEAELQAAEKARLKAASKGLLSTKSGTGKTGTDTKIGTDTKTGTDTKAGSDAAKTGADSKQTQFVSSKSDATKSVPPQSSSSQSSSSHPEGRKQPAPAQRNAGRPGRANQQELVPPPPPYAVPVVSNSPDTPERKALELIKNKKYATAESKLQGLISDNPDNCHARYLLAIASVMQRKYDEARREYTFVIEHSTDEHLIDLATKGLDKL